ncbi:MAG TPA: hypothetical protein QF555_00540, partial [Candidatus Thalassarchaeaceae archaeon]|nr:hypothetical protein [Candidatus Thalassarchaeaceae archaeon]
MTGLANLSPFSVPSESIRSAATYILENPGKSVTLRAPLSMTGCISLSLIEAALVDLGRPYSRRFSPSTVGSAGILIDIEDNHVEET